jgi:signal transduction histidine kinase
MRAFDAFHRLEGSTGSGSGLGLAIARDAASRLGGVVTLHERVDGSGLVFRYTQPQTRAATEHDTSDID